MSSKRFYATMPPSGHAAALSSFRRQRLLSRGAGRFAAAAAVLVRNRLANHSQELILVGAHPQTLFERDLAPHVQTVEVVRQGLHSELLAGLHRRIDLVDLVLA